MPSVWSGVACDGRRLRGAAASAGVDDVVTNQATAHAWQSAHYGVVVEPFGSLEAALESWPETATAVGVRLGSNGAIEIVAPFGLDDLFELRVRPSPALRYLESYRSRIRSKGWAQRWPQLRIQPAGG